MKITVKTRVIDAFVIYVPIVVLCLLIAYPFYYMFINSFNKSLAHHWEYVWPKDFTFNYYEMVFRGEGIPRAILVTALRTVVGIVTTVLNAAMCAFALRKRDLSLRSIYLVIFIIPMFFGGGLIPDYLVFRMYGLLDTFWIYIIPKIFQFFYIIILMAFFRSLSDALEDSAKIDGAGYFTIFMRIYLPISLPVLAVIALFSGVNHWEEWFDTLYFTRKKWLTTLPAILVRVIRQAEQVAFGTTREARTMDESARLLNINPDGIKIATMFVAITPVLCIYPFLQRFFVKGLMIGSLKG